MKKSDSITLDSKTFEMAAHLAKIYNKSVPETIRVLLKKEIRLIPKGKKKSVMEFKISRGVEKISGILKTNHDYKTLRDMCIEDKLEKYEGTG